MANQQLEAQRRTVLGKKVKAMRREGRVPGIVYGPVVEETVPVSVDRRDFLKFYQMNGHSTLFDLTWDGGKQSVFIHDVQIDPVRRDPVHVEFFAPNLRRPVRAMVPLVLHNPVSTAEAVMTEARTDVEVEALPARIPHQIDVDVSVLEHPGDVLRVGDLIMPRDVVVVTDEHEIVAQMEAIYRPPEEEEAAEAAPAAAEAKAAVTETVSSSEAAGE
jgi:large subunit ribosomal protein L25